MDHAAAAQALQTWFAPWVRELAWGVASIEPGAVVLTLPVDDRLTHVAGVLCGQAMMAAADTAMVLAVASALGGYQPMTTVSAQTTFLRPMGSGLLHIHATVLRQGRQLVYGDVHMLDGKHGKRVAHATLTCMLLGAGPTAGA